jgi:hypothetical protein
MTDDEKLKAILDANPVLAEKGFAKSVDRWNKLNEIADARGLNRDDAAAFIAYFMTGGKEGRLP